MNDLKRWQSQSPWQATVLGAIVLSSIALLAPVWLAPIGLGSIAQAQTQTQKDNALIATTLQKLRGRTPLPILLPTPPSDYTRISTATANEYSIDFDVRPNCGGTPCNIASISATRGGQFSSPGDYQGPRSRTANVKLKSGTAARFFSGCGAYCSAILQWKTGDVLYSVYIKNGDLEGTLGLANSAVVAGIRQVPQRSVLAYAVGAKVELTNPSGYTTQEAPINIRDRPGTQSKVLHIGYPADPLRVMGRAVGPDQYGWYQVKFEKSGAMGWVREDFVERSY
jgi:hypothetical protein